ncbi:hypothetical protein ACO22_05301 [Paracoccidioides brasiliensis]|uniref:Uncharacterized protein n=1 Tax=Paracoccidioides brasiliensis TaxID=121759 RepID=A0A1D2JAM4_PARBR|nr:hypothetical protein ACO22_05301 [Paracoccidioides brasiliensis]
MLQVAALLTNATPSYPLTTHPDSRTRAEPNRVGKQRMDVDMEADATPRIYCPRPVVSSPLYLAHSVARVAKAGEGLVPPRLSAHGERGVEALVLSGTWEGWVGGWVMPGWIFISHASRQNGRCEVPPFEASGGPEE